jgi:hypothetical protein
MVRGKIGHRPLNLSGEEVIQDDEEVSSAPTDAKGIAVGHGSFSLVRGESG